MIPSDRRGHTQRSSSWFYSSGWKSLKTCGTAWNRTWSPISKTLHDSQQCTSSDEYCPLRRSHCWTWSSHSARWRTIPPRPAVPHNRCTSRCARIGGWSLTTDYDVIFLLAEVITGAARILVCRHRRDCSTRWDIRTGELVTPYIAIRHANSIVSGRPAGWNSAAGGGEGWSRGSRRTECSVPRRGIGWNRRPLARDWNCSDLPS